MGLATVALIATIAGEPAFQQVEWNVPNTDDKHSLVVEMPVGTHIVCARLKGMEYSLCSTRKEVVAGKLNHIVVNFN
ncbi:hypothetical protein N9043_00555 [bacterium]|nr:hypothetical protein [bacterium]